MKIIDLSEYIGKEFKYVSKYNGISYGIVNSISHNLYEIPKPFADKLWRTPIIIGILSENGIFYRLDEIIIKN